MCVRVHVCCVCECMHACVSAIVSRCLCTHAEVRRCQQLAGGDDYKGVLLA